MPTRFSVRVRKWVEPIQAFNVPNGCSTVCLRMAHAVRRLVEPVLHSVQHALVLPACDAAHLGGRALGLDRAFRTLSWSSSGVRSSRVLSTRLNHHFMVSPAGHR